MHFINILVWRKAEKIVREWEKQCGPISNREQAIRDVKAVLDNSLEDLSVAVLAGLSDSVFEGFGVIIAHGVYSKNKRLELLAALAEYYCGKKIYVDL